MSHPQFNHPRLEELLAQRAVFELTADEQAELDRLLVETGVDAEAFERTAALAELAMHSGPFEAMPKELKAQIVASAAAHMGQGSGAEAGVSVGRDALAAAFRGFTEREIRDVEPAGGARTLRLREVMAWLVAAACVLIAFSSWFTYRWSANNKPVDVGALVEARAALEKSPNTIVAPWTATDDPAGKGASGDVVWNTAKQEGFLRFKGLAANDAKQNEYQLWIFDGKQDERYPIDGGVFDVDAKTGEVIVPIHAKLRVVDPKLFAVTVEKPGGVVVSSRERIALTAKPEPAG